MLPSGDFYLCKTCYENAIDFVGDPTIHHWETVHVAIEGRGSDSTYVVERCRICGDLRVDDDTAVVEWIGGENDESGERQDVDEDTETKERASHERSAEPSPGGHAWE